MPWPLWSSLNQYLSQHSINNYYWMFIFHKNTHLALVLAEQNTSFCLIQHLGPALRRIRVRNLLSIIAFWPSQWSLNSSCPAKNLLVKNHQCCNSSSDLLKRKLPLRWRNKEKRKEKNTARRDWNPRPLAHKSYALPQNYNSKKRKRDQGQFCFRAKKSRLKNEISSETICSGGRGRHRWLCE